MTDETKTSGELATDIGCAIPRKSKRLGAAAATGSTMSHSPQVRHIEPVGPKTKEAQETTKEKAQASRDRKKPQQQGADGSTAARRASAKQPPRETKTEIALKALRRKRGVSIAELQEITGWQAHSVRGFLSGTVNKKLGLVVANEVGKDGVRRYRVDDAARARSTGQSG